MVTHSPRALVLAAQQERAEQFRDTVEQNTASSTV
jgi:hypothetical protein